jgi:hypothetical protein
MCIFLVLHFKIFQVVFVQSLFLGKNLCKCLLINQNYFHGNHHYLSFETFHSSRTLTYLIMKEEKKINVNSSYEGNQVSMSSNSSLRTTYQFWWLTKKFIELLRQFTLFILQSLGSVGVKYKDNKQKFSKHNPSKNKKILKGLKILNKY